MKKLRDSIQYAGDFELKECIIITHQGAEVDLLPNSRKFKKFIARTN